MLDCSPAKIKAYTEKYGIDFWQLRTPLTQYALAGTPYGLDNGCFTKFEEKTFFNLLEQARETPPIFACLPDIVGDARRTLELFKLFEARYHGVKKALVLQDGIGQFPIDWNSIDAVFVGGSDAFKISAEAMAACKTAKILGKWVHVGRVNTAERVQNWVGVADSIDGSGISKYDHMLESVIAAIHGEKKQTDLFKEI